MSSIVRLVALVCVLGVTGCSGAFRSENVTGSWSCPLVNGVCADIDTIDRDASTAKAALSPGGAAGPARADKTSWDADAIAPSRSPDEIARIVFAPGTDTSGHLHGRRVIFAVMRPGTWYTPAHKPSTSLRGIGASTDNPRIGWAFGRNMLVHKEIPVPASKGDEDV